MGLRPVNSSCSAVSASARRIDGGLGYFSIAWITGSLGYLVLRGYLEVWGYLWKVFPCSLLSHTGNFPWNVSESENRKGTQFYLSCSPLSCVLCSGICLYICLRVAHVWVTWTCTCMHVEPWGKCWESSFISVFVLFSKTGPVNQTQRQIGLVFLASLLWGPSSACQGWTQTGSHTHLALRWVPRDLRYTPHISTASSSTMEPLLQPWI